MSNPNPLIADINSNGIELRKKFFPISLPSRGFYYDDDAIDGDVSNLRVYPLTVTDESIITDPLMLLSGHSFRHLMEHAVPDMNKIDQMVDMDITVIMLAARIAGHGEKYSFVSRCPKCEHEQKVEVNLRRYLEQYTPLTDEEIDNYRLTIDDLKQEVILKPVTYNDAIEVIKSVVAYNKDSSDFMANYDPVKSTPEEDKRYAGTIGVVSNTNETMAEDSIMAVITSDGQELVDPALIAEWVKYIGEKYQKMIVAKIMELQQDFSKRGELDIKCEKCQHEYKTSVEVDPQKLFTIAGEEPDMTPTPAKKKPTPATKKVTSKRLSK